MFLFQDEQAYYNIFRGTRRRATRSRVSILDLDAAKSTSLTADQYKAVELLEAEMNDPASKHAAYPGATRATVFRDMFWRPAYPGFWKGGYPFEMFVEHDVKATDSFVFNFRPEFYGVMRTYDGWMSELRFAPDILPRRVPNELNMSEFVQHAESWIANEAFLAEEDTLTRRGTEFTQKVISTIAMNASLRADLTAKFDKIKKRFIANDADYENAQTLMNALEKRRLASVSPAEQARLTQEIDALRYNNADKYARTERLARGKTLRSFEAPQIYPGDSDDVKENKRLKAATLITQKKRLEELEKRRDEVIKSITELTFTTDELTPHAASVLKHLQQTEMELDYHIVLLKYTDYDVSDASLKAIAEKNFSLLVSGDMLRKLSSLESFIIYNDRLLDSLKSFTAAIGNPTSTERRTTSVYSSIEGPSENMLTLLTNDFTTIVNAYRQIGLLKSELLKERDSIETGWATVKAKRSKLFTTFYGRIAEYFSKGASSDLKCCCCVARAGVVPPPPPTKKRSPSTVVPPVVVTPVPPVPVTPATVVPKTGGTLPIPGRGFYFDAAGKSAYGGFTKQTGGARFVGAGGSAGGATGGFGISNPDTLTAARKNLAHVEPNVYYLNGDMTKKITVFLEDAPLEWLDTKQIRYYNAAFDRIAIDLKADPSYDIDTFGSHVIPERQTVARTDDGHWAQHANPEQVRYLIYEDRGTGAGTEKVVRYFPTLGEPSPYDVLSSIFPPTDKEKGGAPTTSSTINPANPGRNAELQKQLEAAAHATAIESAKAAEKARKDAEEVAAKQKAAAEQAQKSAAENRAAAERVVAKRIADDKAAKMLAAAAKNMGDAPSSSTFSPHPSLKDANEENDDDTDEGSDDDPNEGNGGSKKKKKKKNKKNKRS